MGLSRKQREANQSLPRASEKLRILMGTKMVLDCGHRVTLGHSLTNTMIVHSQGYRDGLKTMCHNCGY